MEERYPSPGLMDLAAILHQMLRAQDRGAEGREGRDRREGGREGREELKMSHWNEQWISGWK